MVAPQLFRKATQLHQQYARHGVRFGGQKRWRCEPSKDFAHGGLSQGFERSNGNPKTKWRWDLARTEEIDHFTQSADDFVSVSCNQGIEQVLRPHIVVRGRRRLAMLRVLEA